MKKLFALLLTAVMCFSLVSAAIAAEAPLAAGGWSVNDEIIEAPMPDDAGEIFEKAMEGLVGVGYEPIAVLGAQVVAGLNIAYLCKATTVTAEPRTYLAIVVVYKDLEGNATVTKIKEIDFAKLLEDEEETAEEVTFNMVIENTLTGDVASCEVKTSAKTLGEYIRTAEGFDWEDSEYGIFVTGINGVVNDDDAAAYWSYYVDGEYAMVGADECELKDGMEIKWAYEVFVWEE